MQRRARLREQCDQGNKTDHRDHDHVAIPRTGGVDSEGDEIVPIYLDRSGRHIGEIVCEAIHAVNSQVAEDGVFLPMRANLL